ncbi:MAG: hypothetical protein QNJ47_21040, partial [Nostocaceae cyanobacterium]|nr:hypothetical protein [Nostocaceae cyanobacterium]
LGYSAQSRCCVYMLPLRGSKLQPNNRNRLRWVEGLRNFNTSKTFVSEVARVDPATEQHF